MWGLKSWTTKIVSSKANIFDKTTKRSEQTGPLPHLSQTLVSNKRFDPNFKQFVWCPWSNIWHTISFCIKHPRAFRQISQLPQINMFNTMLNSQYLKHLLHFQASFSKKSNLTRLRYPILRLFNSWQFVSLTVSLNHKNANKTSLEDRNSPRLVLNKLNQSKHTKIAPQKLRLGFDFVQSRRNDLGTD